MELLTTKTLWYGFDPSAEQLDVTVARVEKEEKLTFKKSTLPVELLPADVKLAFAPTFVNPTKGLPNRYF